MIPIGPILWALYSARNANGRAEPVGPGVVWWVCRSLLGLLTCGMWLDVIPERFAPLPGIAVVAWLVLMELPGVVLAWVIVPLKLPRAAYWFARVMVPYATVRAPRAGAAFYGLLALMRRGEPTRLERQSFAIYLSKRSLGPHYGMEIAAHGLLAAATGDVERARDLLRAVSRMKSDHCPWIARRMARRWLVADALTRGDLEAAMLETARRPGWAGWADLVGFELRWRRYPHTFPLMVQRPFAWVFAGRRVATWRWLRDVVDRNAATVAPAAAGDALVDALACHRALLTTSPTTRGWGALLGETFARWDAAAANPALDARVRQRSMALGVTVEGATLLDGLLLAAGDDLAAVVRGTTAPLPMLTEGTIGERVLWAAREDDLAEVEALVGALRDRQQELDPVDEWRELSRVQTAVERAARRHGAALRMDLCDVAFNGVTDWAVVLFNDRGQRPMAHEAFRWAKDLAEGVCTEETWTLACDNERSGWY